MGEEVILSEQKRTLGVQVRGSKNTNPPHSSLKKGGSYSHHSEEQQLQSAECWLKTQAVCKTFQPNVGTFNANVVIDNEESHKREDFTNNVMFRAVQEDEIKHVIVSDSETIQSIDNQKQLQGKIGRLRETSCPPLVGDEFADGLRETSPDSERPTSRVRKLENTNEGTQFEFSTEDTFNASWARPQIEYTVAKQHVRNSESVEQIQDRPKSMISRRGKINCHEEENGSLSLNNFVEAIPLTCTPKVRFSSLRTASSPARGEEIVDVHKISRKVAFTEPSRGMSGAKVEQTSTETLSFRCVCERCRLMRGEVNNENRKVAFTLAEGATHVANSNNSRKVAFTLAETLITLGIIGVVAALTISALIKNYQKQVTVTKLQKAYSVINQAFKQSEVVNDSSEFWDDPFVIRSQAYFEKYFKPYLNGAKQCFSYQECGYTERCPYKYLNNTKFVTSMDSVSLKSDRFAFYLPDGTFYWFLVAATGANGESVPNNTLYIDINGGQGPNIISKDVFIFERVPGKGILPHGYKYSKSSVNSDCLTGSGSCCAMKIMQDGWKITYPY